MEIKGIGVQENVGIFLVETPTRTLRANRLGYKHYTAGGGWEVVGWGEKLGSVVGWVDGLGRGGAIY